MKVLDVIKQIQQAIVYIEDRLLEPFNLQELSDYVGLSPYHLDQSFKMIVGQSPEEYARARKMTIAANDVVNGASRLMDVAKKYRYANSNDFANDFSDFHGISPIQATTKKDELKIQQRLYIKLSTTENAPYTYRLQETDDISLVGYSRFIPTEQLSNPFNIPDFLEDLLVDGYIKELKRYNDTSPYELFVVSCPLEQGLEIFVGVPSERYPHILKADFYLVAIMHCLIYKVKLIMLQTRLGIILSLACNLLYLMSEIVYMLRFIHLIFHLMTHSLRFNYGCLLNKNSMI